MKRVNVAYSLITDETKSKVLLVRNLDHSSWSFPGGAVEPGESLARAAIREAKEETGLDVKVFGILSVNECRFEKWDEHAIFFVFRAEAVGGAEEISRPDEIAELVWVDLDQADEYMPYYKTSIREIARRSEIPYFDQGTK